MQFSAMCGKMVAENIFARFTVIKEDDKFRPSALFEGMTSIRAVLRAADEGISDRRIREILYDKQLTKSHIKEINYLSKIAPARGFTLRSLPHDELAALAIGSSHGGILADCTERTLPELSDAMQRGEIPPRGFYAMLDGIEDPYNFGYALRSIYAAGADGVILPRRNWLSAAGVVARASAGASELLRLYTADADEAAVCFKKAGYRIVCADKPNSTGLYETDLCKPVFLIVGGEKRGIRASVLKQADAIVRIDYGRDFPAALSAASAATIIAYEVFRQNRETKNA